MRIYFAFILLILIGFAHAANITVCHSGCDYKSIQMAVYAAYPNDTIVMEGGKYNESVFLTKSLNFIGVEAGGVEPDVQGDLYTRGHRFSLQGFSFSFIQDSPDSSSSTYGSAVYWIGKGDQFGNSGNNEESIRCYDNATKLDPSLATAWNNKGYALDSLGKYEEAITAYDEAIKIDRNYATAWNNKGLILYSLSKYDEAIKAYDEAIRIDRNDTGTWNNKGTALYSLGKYDEAVKAYDEAISIDRNFATALSNKGYALVSLGKYNESVQSFEQGLKINETDALAWNGMGQSLDALKRYDEALQAFDKAIKLDADYSQPWNNKGKVFYELKRFEEAVEACDEAIRIDRNNSAAWNNKGAALAALGKYDDAVSSYDEALRLNPTNEAALKNREDALKKLGPAGKTDTSVAMPRAYMPALAPAIKFPVAAPGTSNEENPAPTTDLLYSDDFSSYLNWRDKWAIHVNKDGRHYITISKRQYWSLRNPTIKAFKDCIIEAEATLEDDSQDSAFGLQFRHTKNNFYRFKISGKGEFGFDLQKNGKWDVLIPWTKSAAINSGKASNLIRVQCRGNRFTFYANGVNLGEYIDDTFPDSGMVGVFADSASSNGVQVSFDNLKIWAVTA